MLLGSGSSSNDYEEITQANIKLAVNMYLTNKADAVSTYGPIDTWDTSRVTDMLSLFENATNFNQPLNSWNVSNVTSMTGMFANARSFNQLLDNWNVSKVTNIGSMFYNAKSFNLDLSTWTTGIDRTDSSKYINFACGSLLEHKAYYPKNSDGTQFTKAELGCTYTEITQSNIKLAVNMYLTNKADAVSTYGPIDTWDTSRVTDMLSLFENATNFNQPLNSWNVSNVTSMTGMFYNATNFNQYLSAWNTSNVTDMRGMFANARSFNKNLSPWNTSNVTDMRSMFYNATNFYSPLNNWTVSKVTNIGSMFYNAKSFNQDLSTWTTGIDGTDPSKYTNFACASLLENEAYYPKKSTGVQFKTAQLGCN